MPFGAIPGIPVGTIFENKVALKDAGVHTQVYGGMRGGKAGTESIVLNEGYVDDEDLGDVIIYTGHGGQDAEGRQAEDQKWHRANLGMKTNMTNGLPVRVIRGSKLKSPYAPIHGFRYDGLYTVEACWDEPSIHGPRICRFRLIKTDDD